MPKSLGRLISAGLKDIKEPEVTAFTTGDILQEALIEEANNASRDILARIRYKWGLQRTSFLTTDNIDTGTVAVTNGSTAITSKDASGVDADNFTNAVAGMYLRVTGDNTSYKLDSVTTAASPDTAVLEQAYQGTTATAAGYDIIHDEYGLTDTDMDRIHHVIITEDQGWGPALSSQFPHNELGPTALSDILAHAGGDVHRNASGVPRMWAEIGRDSSDQRQIVLWPYPRDSYLVQVWYQILVTENSTFDTNMLGGDAPEIAYDAIEARVCARAQKWDKNMAEFTAWMQIYEHLVRQLIKHDRTNVKHSMRVWTGRRRYGRGVRSESQNRFDMAGVR